MSITDPITDLVELSRELGRPERDWVILGEGNTSAALDAGRFLVKASGSELGSATARNFVAVHAAPVLALLDAAETGDDEIRRCLMAARVDPAAEQMPSIETLLHAVCLRVPGVRFVAHTHPTAVNAVTCSQAFETALRGRLFPDEIVVCGPAPLLVPYTDPGVPLARAVAAGLSTFAAEHGEPPRTIWMQNHGLVTLGTSARHALDLTSMATKLARILGGTMAFGGPRFLPQVAVDRIHRRPDEIHRQRVRGHRPPTT